MFTGIIEAIGKVREPEKLGDGVRLTIDTPARLVKRNRDRGIHCCQWCLYDGCQALKQTPSRLKCRLKVCLKPADWIRGAK